MRGGPVQGTNIESILESVEFFIVDIDQSHIVVFARENLCHGSADLSCAQDDDFHGYCSLRLTSFIGDTFQPWG